MYITKKHISRRTALHGIGVTLSLPLLEAMLPAQTPMRQTAAATKTRLAALEMVHGSAGSTGDGTRLHYWSPEKQGRDFEITQILRSLAPHQEYLTVVSHTDIAPATASMPAEAGADHTRSSAAFADGTAVTVRGLVMRSTGEDNEQTARTVDRREL